MTTFTLRASEVLTRQLGSAEMRSWLSDFLRSPHPLLPDPGSGHGRVSLTLPETAVRTVAAYCDCGVSSALRRIAVENVGLPATSTAVLPKTSSEFASDASASMLQDYASQDKAIVGKVALLVVWLMFAVAFFYLLLSKKDTEAVHTQPFPPGLSETPLSE